MSVLNDVKSKRYSDKTEFFEKLFSLRYCTLTNCHGTGSSFLLKTLACFLDKNIDSRSVFQNLKIGGKDIFSKEINSYHVLFLDFSDFHAESFNEAVEYLKDKMSDIYKDNYKLFEPKGDYFLEYLTFENALDIIEKKGSCEDLLHSFSRLLWQFKNRWNRPGDAKRAILIDNLVSLEVVAAENGYYEEIKKILKTFLVEDIYKYCDFFLQTDDSEEEKDPWFACKPNMVYRYFGVMSFDLRERFPEMVVPEECKCKFDSGCNCTKGFGWDAYISDGRKRIRQAKELEERRHNKAIRLEKIKYAENLSPEIPVVSPNLGIRKKHLDKNSSEYAKLNAFIRAIYNSFCPKFDAENVYCYFQSLEYNNRIISDIKSFESILAALSDGNAKWKKAEVNASDGFWIQTVFARNEFEYGDFPAKPQNIKVYVCFKHIGIQDFFVDSLKYLLHHAKKSFAAKIAVINRSDQMCYWLSQNDFNYLEEFYRPYANDMVESLPFVAYKGKLGISRDFPGIDSSHNSTMAYIISDYLKTVKNAGEIDLEDMYNNYISKWNGDLYEECGFGGFKNNSALSFIVILDTLDVLLGEAVITDHSFLLSGDARMWQVLAESRCWSDVNNCWVKSDPCNAWSSVCRQRKVS